MSLSMRCTSGRSSTLPRPNWLLTASMSSTNCGSGISKKPPLFRVKFEERERSLLRRWLSFGTKERRITCGGVGARLYILFFLLKKLKEFFFLTARAGLKNGAFSVAIWSSSSKFSCDRSGIGDVAMLFLFATLLYFLLRMAEVTAGGGCRKLKSRESLRPALRMLPASEAALTGTDDDTDSDG